MLTDEQKIEAINKLKDYVYAYVDSLEFEETSDKWSFMLWSVSNILFNACVFANYGDLNTAKENNCKKVSTEIIGRLSFWINELKNLPSKEIH